MPHYPVLALMSSIRWCPEEITEFCSGKAAVLVVEEGQPEFIEQEIATLLPARSLKYRA